MEEDISRDTYPNPFEDDGEDIRVYTKTQDDGTEVHMASVTTVLETRDDDKSNLYAWQERNDGTGDNAFHEHLFWYSRHIGTLGHWHALKELDNDLDAESADSVSRRADSPRNLEWTEDEAESAWILNNIDTVTDDSEYEAYSERLGREFTVDGEDHPEIQDSSPRQVLYSVLKSQHGVETWGEFFDKFNPYAGHDYYSGEILQQADADISFFREGQKRLWSKLNITADDIIAVEQFLFNEEFNYAGQVDLVYEDSDGNVVVADLKSSSGCYDKHQMQGAAYGKAIEMADNVDVDSVDRLEVHRVHPRSGQMAVHTSRHSDTQPIHTTQYWADNFETLWQDFESLTSNFDEVNFAALMESRSESDSDDSDKFSEMEGMADGT